LEEMQPSIQIEMYLIASGQTHSGFVIGPSKEWILEDILKTYENYVRTNPFLINSLHELKGKQLGCWCKPNKCHGDVLLKLYNEFCEKGDSVIKTI
jgi:hypothetical protein